MVATSKSRHERKFHESASSKKRKTGDFQIPPKGSPTPGSPDTLLTSTESTCYQIDPCLGNYQEGYSPDTLLTSTESTCYQLDPCSGYYQGGYYVKISGSKFPDNPVVQFGGGMISPDVASDKSIIFKCPPGEPDAKVEVYPF
jgi:hypothetical protein